MGLEDFFEQDNKHHKYDKHYRQGHNKRYEQDDDDDYNYSRSHGSGYDLKLEFLEKIKNNPKLKTLVIMALAAIAILAIIAVILLFPLLSKLLNYISENGIQGAMDAIWKGSK